ncbi:class I SAM-dependent methyltransferase [Saccharopolyspora elongata]|uniref:class I SAM-dependent methyltransferase n=1 Tax=Saccharopolyspora elongata TaxID=2530387 RepID=UPI001A9EFCC0|nr:class I SAM-dependent methyltransferase [Saccharopolyspora elongata]
MTEANCGTTSPHFTVRSPASERVLSRVDSSPYGWLAEPLHDISGLIVDIGCGTAPTREHLIGRRWVGVDLSSSELAVAVAAGRCPLVQARADALPVADNAADAVCAAMSLQVLTPLSAALAEIARILRPGGLLAALVPSRLGFAPRGWLGWASVLNALGVTSHPWLNPRVCDGVVKVLGRRSFEIVSSHRRTFLFPISTGEAAELLVDSLYLPGTSADRIAAAKHTLGAWARPGRTLPLPLRRVVARRQVLP